MPSPAAIKTLIVDKEKSMRALVRECLYHLGVSAVSEAGDGVDALKIISTRPINLVLCEYDLPKLDGLALLRSVRASAKYKDVGFIMLSGRSDIELVQRAVQFGANNYIVKPVSVLTVQRKISEIFGALT